MNMVKKREDVIRRLRPSIGSASIRELNHDIDLELRRQALERDRFTYPKGWDSKAPIKLGKNPIDM